MFAFIISLIANLVYFTFYFKAIQNSNFKEAILIATYFPIVAFIINLQSFTLVFYIILCTLPLFVKYVIKIDFRFRRSYIGIFAFLSLIILYSLMMLSVTYAPKAGGSYYNEKFLFYTTNILLPVTLLLLVNSETSDFTSFGDSLIWVTFVSSLIPIVNIIDLGFLEVLQKEFFYRLSINDLNPIWFGRFLSFGLVVTLFRVKNLFIKSVYSFVVVIAIFFTGSKAVLYSSILILFIYLFATYLINKRSNYNPFKIVFVIGGISLVLFFLFSNTNELAIERRFSNNSATIDVRTEAVKELLNNNDSPIIGNGLSSGGYALTGSDQRMYPHNVYVELYYEFGIIGLIIYNVSFFLVLFKLKNQYIKGLLISDESLTLLSLILLSFLYSQTSGDLNANQFGIIFSLYYLIKS